jgi:hypothetical protein
MARDAGSNIRFPGLDFWAFNDGPVLIEWLGIGAEALRAGVEFRTEESEDVGLYEADVFPTGKFASTMLDVRRVGRCSPTL